MIQYRTKILVSILVGKLIILLWTIYNWSTGGFSKEEFLSTLNMIAPIFSTYIGLSIGYYLKEKDVEKDVGKVVFYIFLCITAAYALFFVKIVSLKVEGVFSFSEMCVSFTIIEALLGVYIGLIIKKIFDYEK